MSASETTELAHSVGDGNSLEADDAVVDDGNDSAIGADAESVGSASLTSSIIGYKYENGEILRILRLYMTTNNADSDIQAADTMPTEKDNTSSQTMTWSKQGWT